MLPIYLLIQVKCPIPFRNQRMQEVLLEERVIRKHSVHWKTLLHIPLWCLLTEVVRTISISMEVHLTNSWGSVKLKLVTISRKLARWNNSVKQKKDLQFRHLLKKLANSLTLSYLRQEDQLPLLDRRKNKHLALETNLKRSDKPSHLRIGNLSFGQITSWKRCNYLTQSS